jgi:transposase-like protein
VDRRAKIELFEQIRREYEHSGGTIREIAKKLGIHRRMVREAVLSAVPVERKTPVRERPKLEPAMAFIDDAPERAASRGKVPEIRSFILLLAGL